MCAGRPAGGEYCVKHLTECAALGRPLLLLLLATQRFALGFFLRPAVVAAAACTHGAARPSPAAPPVLCSPDAGSSSTTGHHTGHRGTGDTVTGTNGAVVLTPPDNALWCILYVHIL